MRALSVVVLACVIAAVCQTPTLPSRSWKRPPAIPGLAAPTTRPSFVPLAFWAGTTNIYDGRYVSAVGRTGESELVRSTTSPVDAILVGLEPRTGLTLTEPVAFRLTVETV